MKATLPGDLQAAAQARTFVASNLQELAVGGDVPVDDVLIVADELVTNAVQAGATSVEVKLRTRDQRLELIVTDDAAGWPTPRPATDRDVDGRGLTIVAHLSDEWTVAGHTSGKSVIARWFSKKFR